MTLGSLYRDFGDELPIWEAVHDQTPELHVQSPRDMAAEAAKIAARWPQRK